MYTKLILINTVSAKYQNKINQSIILNYLRENNNSNISRALIARELNISAPTVSKIIDELIKEKYVIEVGKEDSTGGKRAMRLEFNRKLGSVVGIDLGKDNIRIGRFDLGCEMLDKNIGFKIFYNDKELLNKIIDEIKLFIHDTENKNRDSKPIPINAISLGIPADIDINTGSISAPLFENWDKFNLPEIFKTHFDIPVFFENSKNISTLGEKHFGAGKKYKDFVLLEIGEGIGAGIIINNQLYRGAYNSAGEVGFLVGNANKLYSKYKLKGYMEEVVSPRNLENEARILILEGAKSLISNIVSNDLNKIDPSIVCRAAVLEDELSERLIKKLTENLAIILSDLILIINPQAIVITGDILDLPDVDKLIIEPVKNLICNVIPFNVPDIMTSSLGIDAGIYGSAIFAIDNLLINKFPYGI